MSEGNLLISEIKKREKGNTDR